MYRVYRNVWRGEFIYEKKIFYDRSDGSCLGMTACSSQKTETEAATATTAASSAAETTTAEASSEEEEAETENFTVL